MKLTLQEEFTCMSLICDTREEGRGKKWDCLGQIKGKLGAIRRRTT
jgi:hypothetical protein